MRITGLPWRAKQSVDQMLYRARRTAFIARVRAHAFWQRSSVALDLSPDIKIGKGARATVEPRTQNAIRVGPNCTIGERMLFVMKGGQVELADWVEIRRDGVFTVAGHLVLKGKNVVQPGVGIHCDDSIVVERMAGISERVTIVDSAHYLTAPDDWFGDNVKTGPVKIEYQAWIGANSTIARNVTVGHHGVVAANTLVVENVKPGYLVSGVPGAHVRRIVPWLDDDDRQDSDRVTG